jgi:hypothetical protein
MIDKTQIESAKGTQRLEVDTFCADCGYNLHGQNVWRDENLGLMICRCPECGKFHPAGTGVSASSVWLNRFGFTLLVGWIVFCLFVLFIGGGIWFGMQMSYLENFTEIAYVTPDGPIADINYTVQRRIQPNGQPQMVQQTYLIRGTNQPAPVATQKRIYRVPVDYSRAGNPPLPLWEAYTPYVLVNFFDSMIIGILIAAAFFHLRRRAYFSLVLPAFAAIIAFLVWKTEPFTDTFTVWSLGFLSLWSLFDISFLALGIGIGRPVCRLVVSLLIPPKPRQYFAFLWLADGKNFPATVPKA